MPKALGKRRGGKGGKYEMLGDILCRLEIELVPVKRLIHRYENEELDELKTQISSEIDKIIEELFKRYKFFLWNGHGEEDMTLDMMHWVS